MDENLLDIKTSDYIQVDDKMTAEEAIVVDNPGTFIIRLTLSDGKRSKERIRRAKFICEVQ